MQLVSCGRILILYLTNGGIIIKIEIMFTRNGVYYL